MPCLFISCKRKDVFILGIQSRNEKVDVSMNLPIEIDLDVDMRMPSKVELHKTSKKYKCLMCGDSWDAQKNHFSKSNHPKY